MDQFTIIPQKSGAAEGKGGTRGLAAQRLCPKMHYNDISICSANVKIVSLSHRLLVCFACHSWIFSFLCSCFEICICNAM